MIHETVAHHRVFALSLDDGSIRTGWPVDLGTAITGAIPFTPAPQNQRGGLTLLDGRVYVPFGGHNGDCATYHGWVVAVPVDDPAHPSAVATPDTVSGAWTPGGGSSDGTSGFARFGNGSRPSTRMNS